MEITTSYEKLWNEWGEDVHKEQEQLDRQVRAADKKITPILISDGVGYFRGSKSNYETTLSKCTCRDFILRKKPCKHMYRLAYQLDLLNLDGVKFDDSISTKKDIGDVMPIIFSLPEDMQKELRDICYSCGNDNKNSLGYILDSEVGRAYIDCGLMCPVTDKKKLLSRFPFSYIRELAKSLTDEKLPRKGSEICDLIVTKFPDTVVNMPEGKMCLELSPNVSHLAMTIRKRLYEKYPAEENSYFF